MKYVDVQGAVAAAIRATETNGLLSPVATASAERVVRASGRYLSETQVLQWFVPIATGVRRRSASYRERWYRLSKQTMPLQRLKQRRGRR